MKINFLTKTMLIIISIAFTLACVTQKPGFELITASEKQQNIEAMKLDDPQKYWNYKVPGMDQVLVGEVNYLDDLFFDIYYPPAFDFKQSIPVVIVANATPHSGMLTIIGKSIRDFRSNFSLGQILAASGMAVIQYEVNNQSKNLEDIIRYLNKNDRKLCIDINRVGLWCDSRNTFPTLQISSDLEKRELFTPGCLIIYYPSFKGIYNIPGDVPMLLVEGGDFGGVTATNIDKFRNRAKNEGALLEYILFKNGEPFFVYKTDSEETRKIITRTITFIQENLEI
jgi:hypothetical protein